MHRLSLLIFALAAGGMAAGALPAQTGAPPKPGVPVIPGAPGKQGAPALPGAPGQPGGPPGQIVVGPDQAFLTLNVPANAVVTLGGETMKQSGPTRNFLIPNLKKGTVYEYEVEVKWKEDGKDRTEKRTLKFEAGQPKSFDFGPPAGKKTEPKVEKKAETTPPEKKTEKKVETPPEKKAEKKGENPPEKKVEKKAEKKVETPPEKKTEKKVEAPPDKKGEKKVDTTTDKKTEKKTEKTPDEKKKLPKDLPPEAKLAPAGAGATAGESARTFLFTYAGRVTGLTPGTTARVWLPMATSSGQQEVSVVSRQVTAAAQVAKDQEYGNTILYFEGTAGKGGDFPFEVTYRVRRAEVKTDVQGNLFLKPASGEKVARFLQPDAKVPVEGKPLALLKDNLKDRPLPSDQFAAAKAMYDVVNRYMTYKKVGTGWGQGDALWACDSRYGNCTDFHSLFISMARGNKIPSKFEMGFTIPATRGSGPVGGYHCWAWFLPQGKGWVPVDISEANQHPGLAEYYFGNLSPNRVAFTTGRDIVLVPPQKGPPLNYFIYPYAEVDGKAYPADKIERRFEYKDLS